VAVQATEEHFVDPSALSGQAASHFQRREVISLAVAALVIQPRPAFAHSVVHLRAGETGMFRVHVTLNNHRVPLVGLIDTGATSVQLCAATAELLNLELGAPVEVETFGAQLTGHHAQIDSLAMGDILLRDVAAVVHHPSLRCSGVIIGMSALRKLHLMELRGDKLILKGKSGRTYR
jgi:clan AA aspartic protease (TIGR02281 family)